MDANLKKAIQYVYTGELGLGGIETILYSGAIGSCVVITAFDSERKVGVMAHVMLPGVCPVNNQQNNTRYAANAIDEMLTQLEKSGVKIETIDICLIGGANVLKRDNDTIGEDNLDSVEMLLREKNIEIKAKSTGGFERRSVVFDIAEGCIYYTVGNSKQKVLWQTMSRG